MTSSLCYDIDHMLPKAEQRSLFRSHAAILKRSKKDILDQKQKGEPLGWLDLPFDVTMMKRVNAVVTKTKKFETLLVLGIGGSDLGARAILQALPSKKRVLFAGANTDPDELADVFSLIDWKKTLVNIVSKSGDTIEPMSAFLIARENLKRSVGPKFAEHIVATTDEKKGTLHALAVEEGYHRLVVPGNVGGRFSVLSDVGLFPAMWAGVDVKGLLRGAAAQVESFKNDSVEKQLAAQYAVLHAEAYLKFGKPLFVLMPYRAHLEYFAKWYRQLVAESLGKAEDRDGMIIEYGPTPIAALGATDQHSQIQLYMEGPQDKVLTFIEVESFASKMKLPKIGASMGRMVALSGRPLADLIHAERQATADALASVGRPNGTLVLPKLDAFHLGELFQFFMLATAYLGELLHVNAYNQPGVEEGKRRFWEMMER